MRVSLGKMVVLLARLNKTDNSDETLLASFSDIHTCRLWKQQKVSTRLFQTQLVVKDLWSELLQKIKFYIYKYIYINYSNVKEGAEPPQLLQYVFYVRLWNTPEAESKEVHFKPEYICRTQINHQNCCKKCGHFFLYSTGRGGVTKATAFFVFFCWLNGWHSDREWRFTTDAN